MSRSYRDILKDIENWMGYPRLRVEYDVRRELWEVWDRKDSTVREFASIVTVEVFLQGFYEGTVAMALDFQEVLRAAKTEEQ